MATFLDAAIKNAFIKPDLKIVYIVLSQRPVTTIILKFFKNFNITATEKYINEFVAMMMKLCSKNRY